MAGPRPRREVSFVWARTFAWLGKCRHLAKDDEHLVASSEALIRLAMIGLMLRRLRTAS